MAQNSIKIGQLYKKKAGYEVIQKVTTCSFDYRTDAFAISFTSPLMVLETDVLYDCLTDELAPCGHVIQEIGTLTKVVHEGKIGYIRTWALEIRWLFMLLES